jgi:hypothetical protein
MVEIKDIGELPELGSEIKNKLETKGNGNCNCKMPVE